jgi:hypothetical protein
MTHPFYISGGAWRDIKASYAHALGTQFTCFTSTKVQIVTGEVLANCPADDTSTLAPIWSQAEARRERSRLVCLSLFLSLSLYLALSRSLSRALTLALSLLADPRYLSRLSSAARIRRLFMCLLTISPLSPLLASPARLSPSFLLSPPLLLSSACPLLLLPLLLS